MADEKEVATEPFGWVIHTGRGEPFFVSSKEGSVTPVYKGADVAQGPDSAAAVEEPASQDSLKSGLERNYLIVKNPGDFDTFDTVLELWLPPGNGVTPSVSAAHRYTAADARVRTYSMGRYLEPGEVSGIGWSYWRADLVESYAPTGHLTLAGFNEMRAYHEAATRLEKAPVIDVKEHVARVRAKPAAGVDFCALFEALARNINWELSWGETSAEEGALCMWRVHERSGGRNDQAWELLGAGETPDAAIAAALSGRE